MLLHQCHRFMGLHDWIGRCVSSWWPLFPSRNSVLIYHYLYICILYTNSGYRTYIYIHREGRVVQYWWSCIPSQSIGLFCGVRGSCVECHVLFSLVSPIVSCSMIIRLILGCLWPLAFVLNNIMTLGILRSAISHLSGCFCPWTFFQNIGFNMVSLDPFVSHIHTQLWYSTGGVSGFATDCSCGVWCHGLTTCLLHVLHVLEIDF